MGSAGSGRVQPMPISKGLTEAIRPYLLALRSYLRCPTAPPDFFSSMGEPRAITEPTDQATLLTKTRVPIRGVDGTRVMVRNDEAAARQAPPTIGAALSAIVAYSASPPKEGAPCFAERAEMHRSFSAFCDALYDDTELALRILDGGGYKTYA